MARDPVVAGSHRPSAIAPATPAIAHVQLRDLLICPRETGVVNYVVPQGIVEQDLHAPGAPVRTLAKLGFTPNCLTSLQLGADDYLIAAGGQEKEIHLSYHAPSSSKSRSNSTSETQRKTRVIWEFEDHLTGSINNSVLLTSLNLTRSNESGVEPRVGISNNDGTVRLYDVPLRVQNSRRRLKEVGVIELDVPINHSSISPDGRTLLSVGDSNKVYFHQINGGSRISFTPITNLIIPPPDTTSFNYTSSPSYSSTSLTAAFSTAFSGDGSKFAVASQEGVVAVWDVRSTRPLKVFHTDRSREADWPWLIGNGGASGWLSDDPWEWTRGTKAPGWCARSVKFNGGEGGRFGKEVMAFTEHTSIVHLVDARTFEIHDIIRVPTLQRPKPKPRAPSVTTSTATSNTRSTSSRRAIPSSSTAAGSSTGEGANLQRHRTLIRRGVTPTSHAQLTRTGSTSHVRGEPRRWNSDWRGILDPPDTSPSTPPSPPLPSRASNARGEGPRHHFATRYATRGAPPRRSAAAATFVAGINTLAEPRVTPRTRSESPTQQTHTPGIVQALGDTFRIPGVVVPPSSPPRPTSSGSGTYSPPASIGDSTWRTLGGGVGPSTTTIVRPATPPWARLVDLASEHAEQNQNQNPDRDDDDDDGMTVDDYDARMNMVLPDQDWELPAERHQLNFAGDELDESMFVVPDLGDRAVESDVHALLAVHGIPSRSPEGSAGGSNGSGGDEADEGYRTYADMDRFMYNYFDTELGHPASRSAVGAEYSSSHQEEPHEEGDGMDIDGDERHHEEEGEEEEEDTECPSDEDSSRVGSPVSASRRIRSSGSPSWQLASPTSRGHTPTPSDNKPSHSSLTSSRGNTSTRKYGYYDGLDIAGMCFDPWGERMYVAGVGIGIGSPGRLVRGSLVSGEGVGMGAVVEWGVNGAEKRWFVDDGWR